MGGDPMQIEKAEKRLDKLLVGTGTQLVKPFKSMLDVVSAPRESSLGGKAAGLAALCERLNVSANAVMAVGDSGNDLDMLRWAGWSVAMGNASQAVLDTRNAHVGRNDDKELPGVAE